MRKNYPKNTRVVAALLLFFFVAEQAHASGVTINSGATVTVTSTPGASLTTNGDFDNQGTFVPGVGTVFLNGITSTTFNPGTSSFYNLILGKTAAADANDNVTVLTNNLTVTGTTTITDGELIQGVTDFTLAGISIAAAGKYSNASTGDLTLSGAVANDGVMAFDANGGGGSTDDILLRSTVNGTQRNWQGSGTFSMTDVDVKDQTAIGGNPAQINPSSSTNSGNNINWFFGSVSIGGTAYTGKAELGTLNNKNLTIVQYTGAVATTYTTMTDGTGAFSLTMTDAQDGDPIIIYLNDEAEEGNLVYISDGLNVADLKLYQNEVSLRNDSGSGVTNANLANIDNGDDDIKYNVSGGNATFESAFELFIFTGSTYAPAGDAAFNDLDLNGDFVMAANAVTCSGVWDATGGAYSSTGTVTFTATAAKSLTSNGDSALASFNNVVFSGAAGQWNLQDNLDVNGNLTITTGTLNANAQTINASGDWTNSDTFLSASGTVNFDGAGTQVLTSVGTGIAADDTAKDFDNVTISGNTLQIASASELEVDGTLQVNASKILDLNAQTLDLNGTLSSAGVVALEGSETIGLGTWDTDSGTTRYYGDTVTIPAVLTTYFNLEFDESVNGQTYTLPDIDLTINGRWTITDGIVAFDNDKSATINDDGATGTALSVAADGTLNNTGTGDISLKAGVANAGTITFNSSDDAGNGISILSVASPTQRNWQGSGTFSMTDVTVQDQTATGGNPPSITAISSTNSGNNVNWLFGGGALSSLSATPASLQAGATGNVTIAFTASSAISSTGKIQITFPAGFDVSGVTTATSASDLDGTLTVSVSGQIVTITRSGGSNAAAGVTVDDLILQGVINPVSAGATGTFTISSLDALNNVIDTGSAAGVTITAAGSSASTAGLVDSTGASTSTFTLGSTSTGKIYVSITDSDENANAGAAETIVVTVSSAATGDQETITLTETGVNTGIFNNTATGLTFDADDAPSSGNGTLETRNNDTVTASYVDNDDGSDTSTTTATIIASEQMVLVTITATPSTITIGETVHLTGTVENRTLQILNGFKLVSNLPAGLTLQTGSAKVSAGTVEASSSETAFVQLSPLTVGEKRTITFNAIAGSNIRPGSYPVTFFAQINPVISNTAMVSLVVKPDPIFSIGTLIGKVYHDSNANGYQDDGELGIPNATLATEQGYVITTDQFGRYHIPDFLSGRHMIKIDRNSLPDGSRLTTPEAVIVSQTDAMLTKANFGVILPDESAAQHDIERDSDMSLLVRKDTASPQKSFALEFHQIRLQKAEKQLIAIKPQLEQIRGSRYVTENSEEFPVLPFRIDMNYAKFVKKWSFELNRYEASDNAFALTQDPKDRKRQTIAIAKEEGEPTASSFRYTWKHLLNETVKGEKKDIPYEVRVTLEDEKGNKDVAVYDLVTHVTPETIEWELKFIEINQAIPIQGTSVILEGKTHANKIVSVFGKEDLTSSEGAFSAQVILPDGKREVPALLYMNPGEKPVRVVRQVDVRDSYLFWVGFTEAEWGKLSAKGNINSLSTDDKARFQDKWYDESRVAYYLKGKIKGKYLITASVDTQRERRELFRSLQPEDYYAVYGDKSSVTADANDTQDKYYLLAEVDKSYFKYGNFNTDFTGTEFADFSRTLHGAKAHYETLSTAPDGKAVTFVTAFTAQARQAAAHNEFLATGSPLYYLKHKEVIEGSDKIKIVVRDKVSGIPLSERALSRSADYSIDYDQGRIRLYRSEPTFTLDSDSILSTGLLVGNPQYLVIDYEYRTSEYMRERTSGTRASHSLFEGNLRVGGTYVSEEKSPSQLEMQGVDASARLPLETEIRAEAAHSTLTATGEFISNDGGLSFSEITRPGGGGDAYLASITTSPVKNLKLASYYRTMDSGFASSGTISESGTQKHGVAADVILGAYGELHAKHEYEELLSNAKEAVNLTGTGKQITDSIQYRYDRDRWGWTAEYRNTRQTELQEHLVGIEGRYDITEKTNLKITGQKSLGDTDNDQVRGTISHKISEDLSVEATQAFGDKGVGSQVGLHSQLLGQSHSFTKGFGTLKEGNQEDKKEEDATTEVGFTRKLNKDTEVKFGKKVGLKNSGGQTFQLKRSTEEGHVLEMSQVSDGDTTTSTYTETTEVGKDLTQYNTVTTTTNKLTKSTLQTKIRGMKAGVLDGRGSIYQEDQTATSETGERTGSKMGGKLQTGEFETIEFAYQHLQDKVAEVRTQSQALGLIYDYFEYDQLRINVTADFRTEDGPSKTHQIFSTGKAEYFINPEWAWVGRYEWSYTQDRLTKIEKAHFSELQTGVAYRPIKNDKLNLFLEYKYLNDADLSGQVDLLGESRSVRQVGRGELAYDLNPKVTLVEKLALRTADTLLSGGGRTESLTYLAAQRVNYHITNRFDLAGEYRMMGQTLADDTTQGFLLEANYRISDALRLAIGYNTARFDSNAASDMNVETSGVYVRIFYDALEELRGVMDKKRKKTKDAAGDLKEQLERASRAESNESSALQARQALSRARDLMDRNLFDEAIEVLRQGLENCQAAALYNARGEKQKTRFDFYLRQGRLMQKYGLYSQAFKSYEKAYRINAFDEGLLRDMAQTRGRIQEILQARRDIRAKQREVFEKLKKMPDAANVLRETIRMHRQMGQMYFDKTLYEDAMQEWQRGLELAKKIDATPDNVSLASNNKTSFAKRIK